MRIGIRLAMIRFTNQRPPEDQVKMIQDMRDPRVIVSEFPLDAISNLVRDKQHRRREAAMHAMQIILARGANEFTSLSQEEIEKIAIKAWQMAAAMEAQEGVSAALDTMDKATR